MSKKKFSLVINQHSSFDEVDNSEVHEVDTITEVMDILEGRTDPAHFYEWKGEWWVKKWIFEDGNCVHFMVSPMQKINDDKRINVRNIKMFLANRSKVDISIIIIVLIIILSLLM